MSKKPLTIGRLADTAEVNIETVRYYQRMGLIQEPAKPASGYRVYPQETVTRIRFIKRAQQLGFSLKEITHLLELGDGHCADVRDQATRNLNKIEAQIKDLQAMRNTLKTLINECGAGKEGNHCPIVQSLTDSNETSPRSV